MTILVNGAEHSLDKSHNITSLLDSLQMGGHAVIVELNQTALFPREYSNTHLNDGDKVEIIAIAAGG